MPKNQSGIAHLLVLVAVVGLIGFLLVSQTAPFKDKLFSTLFPKPQSQAAKMPEEPKYASDRVIIQFKKGVSEDTKDKIKAKVKLTKKDVLRKEDKDKGDLELAEIKSGKSVPDVINQLRGDPSIEFVEPDFLYAHQATANDPYFLNGSLWGMGSDSIQPVSQYGSQASKAWADGYTGSNFVYIGVIDQGIQYDHVDLAANIWTNSFDPQDGIDNDGNGYTDDIHGWDFSHNDNSIYDVADGDRHGTHVSGTIGGVGGNNIGVAGVNWKVTIISAKFLSPSGGWISDAVKAVDYLTDLKTRHNLNMVATSNSWGGGGYSQALYDAIERARLANILFVAAAGNSFDDNDSWPMYPASYTNDNIIAVAAIDKNGNLAYFSSYGLNSVDLGAPGVDVYSAVPNSSYASSSGTSMATPHVSGAVAAYSAAHPGKTASEIKNAILGTVTLISSLNGRTVTGGMLNVSGAITGQISPPLYSPTPIPSSVSSRRVFVTGTVVNGKFERTGSNTSLGTAANGLDGADTICQSLANSKSLGGIWKAWLSNSTTSASSRLTHYSGIYVRLDGQKVANDWTDLTDGTLQNPINVNESNTGGIVDDVWTYTKPDGNASTDTIRHCNNWTSSGTGYYGRLGKTSSTDSNWTLAPTTQQDTCNKLKRLYCIEQ